jgi:hypothetical protein
VQRQAGAERVVVGQQAERGLEALRGQLRVGGRRRDVRDAALVVDRRRRDRRAGVQVADDTGDLGVAQLLRSGGALLRIGRVIFGDQLELDLLAADRHALGVEVVDRHARAVLVVLAVVRLRAGHRADVADLDHHVLRHGGARQQRHRRGRDHVQFEKHESS